MPQEQKYLLNEFEKSFGQIRNNYWNGQWDGNQLKSIVQEKNLNKMEKILPKEVQPFTESLRNLRKVYKTVCSSNIDESDDSDDLNKRKKKKIENVTEDSLSKEEKLENYMKNCRESIDNFITSINYLKKNMNFSKTTKIHVIQDHVMDIIELTGEPLGSLDQCIEQLHQYK